MATVKDVYEFIDQAENNRKYAPNTALGRRAALQLYEKVINSEEAKDVSLIYQRLDKIALIVDSKNKSFKSSTLVAYRKRLKKLLEDYETYGKTSTAMNAWDTTAGREPAGSKRMPKASKQSPESSNNIEVPSTPAPMFTNGPVTHELNVQLRADLRIALSLPYDLTRSEADRLKMLIDSMALVGGEPSEKD